MWLHRALVVVSLPVLPILAVACNPEAPPAVAPAQPTSEPDASSEPAPSAAPTTTASAAPTATASAAPTATASATPEAACKGHVDAPPAGLEATNEAPPAFAIGAPEKGALCEGKVFTAKGAVKVYRAFSASYQTSKRAGPLGAYWTFQKPSGKAADYRATYEICAEWNDLDMLNECTIDAGAKVVLGPGQSAKCDSGTLYPASPANQVLVVRGSDGKVPVSNCKQSPLAWTP